MKIEKISETQVKFILSQIDLEERDLSLEELITPSEKTQELFQDIMDQAMDECGFEADDAPLMVEAVPVAQNSIMVIVTKLSREDQGTQPFALNSKTTDDHRFKRKSIVNLESDKCCDENISIYAFEHLDDVIDVSSRLCSRYHGSNSLYKYNNKFFLILQNDSVSDNIETDDLEVILGEYGQKYVSSVLSKYYLVEHGEAILNRAAIKTLAKTFA